MGSRHSEEMEEERQRERGGRRRFVGHPDKKKKPIHFKNLLAAEHLALALC